MSAPAILCVCFPVFQEKPEIPPSQAQAQARSIPPDDYSYTASILRLLSNKPFMLLVVSYGGSLPVALICLHFHKLLQVIMSQLIHLHQSSLHDFSYL